MSRSRIEQVFPTLTPLSRKAGRGLMRAPIGAGRGLRWITRRTWKPVLAIILLALIADGVATLITGRMVEAEIDKIRARGEYLSYKDLAGQPVPDSENGALVYEQAFALMPRPTGLDTACESLRDPEKRAKDPGLWQEARIDIGRYSRTLALIDEAQKMPRCRFKTNWEDGLGALFPYLYGLRQVSRVLCAQGLIKAHDGDMSAGLACVKGAVATAETVRDDPTMICIAVRNAVLNQAAGTLRQIAEMGKMPADCARELSDDLGRIDMVPGFVNGLRGERVWTIGAFDEARTKGAAEFWSMAGGERGPSLWMRFYFSRLGRPWLYTDEIRALRYWDRTLDVNKRDYWAISQREWAGFDRENQECGPIGFVLLPQTRGWHAAVDCSQTQVNGSRLLLALLVYKERFGSYPDTLDRLESSLGWGLNLIDPFSGKEFIYRRVGNGFVFYSVGENLKDDGGKKGPKRTPPLLEDSSGDIVWKMDH